MTLQDLIFEGLRTLQFHPFSSEDMAKLLQAPNVYEVEHELYVISERSPRLLGLSLPPPYPRRWMVVGIEIPPNRKSHEREVAEWNVLVDAGRLR